MSLVDDCEKYKMAAILTTETRISGNIVEEIITSDRKHKYNHYTAGLERNTRYGVGIIISKKHNSEFNVISDRICQLTIKIRNKPNIVYVCAYAPTLTMIEKNPKNQRRVLQQPRRSHQSSAKKRSSHIWGRLQCPNWLIKLRPSRHSRKIW